MPSRFAIGIILASSLSIYTSYAQECGKPLSPSTESPCKVKAEDYDIVIGSMKDYQLRACGIDGRVFLERRPPSDQSTHLVWSLVGVSPDGSITTFELPEMVMPVGVTAGENGVNVVAEHLIGEAGQRHELYLFGSRENLLAKHWLPDAFVSSLIAVLPSQNMIALWSQGTSREDMKYGGAILDADGQIIRRFDLPLPPGGGGWIFASRRMAVGDGVAYEVLQSETAPGGPLTAIATIAENGHLNIKLIPAPPDTERRHHNEWIFGPGVAVEVYHLAGERVTFRFDEYDLKTGEKVANKMAHVGGGALGCYTGTEVSMLVGSAHVDPARGLMPDTLRLAISKLQ